MDTDSKSIFDILASVDVKPYTKTKKTDGGRTELTYLSWSFAWSEVCKRFPDASYEAVKFDGVPFVDTPLGLIVYTSVTIKGKTLPMWLPVMNGSNKAMKSSPYSYKVKDHRTGQMVERWVEAATMFDVNKAIMRCLVKNLAAFGLGLNIYAGEDLPLVEDEDAQDAAKNGPVASPAADPSKDTNRQKKAATAAPVPTADAKAKMREAWTIFCGTTAAKSMDENSRSNLFVLEVKQVTGIDNPRKVTADDWDKVIARLTEVGK